ncbi:MAG TPA: hypothetical protein VKR06_37140 [Ktedonosporobacter sp.]|nr:hypothetical protein [Ktedonosporobacter sp.]
MTISVKDLPSFGLIASAIILGFFLIKGNKKSRASWFATIMGVGLILLVTNYWGALTGLWAPHVSASAHPPVVQGLRDAYQGTAPPPSPAQAGMSWTALANMIAVITFGALLLAVLVGLVVVSVKRWGASAPAPATLPACSGCGKLRELKGYSYQSGSRRVTKQLCQDCATRAGAREATSARAASKAAKAKAVGASRR